MYEYRRIHLGTDIFVHSWNTICVKVGKSLDLSVRGFDLRKLRRYSVCYYNFNDAAVWGSSVLPNCYGVEILPIDNVTFILNIFFFFCYMNILSYIFLSLYCYLCTFRVIIMIVFTVNIMCICCIVLLTLSCLFYCIANKLPWSYSYVNTK